MPPSEKGRLRMLRTWGYAILIGPYVKTSRRRYVFDAVHLGSQLWMSRLTHEPGKGSCDCCQAFEKVFVVLFGPGSSPGLREGATRILEGTYIRLLELSHRLHQGGGSDAPGASGAGTGERSPGGGAASLERSGSAAETAPGGSTVPATGSVPVEEEAIEELPKEKKRQRAKKEAEKGRGSPSGSETRGGAGNGS